MHLIAKGNVLLRHSKVDSFRGNYLSLSFICSSLSAHETVNIQIIQGNSVVSSYCDQVIFQFLYILLILNSTIQFIVFECPRKFLCWKNLLCPSKNDSFPVHRNNIPIILTELDHVLFRHSKVWFNLRISRVVYFIWMSKKVFLSKKITLSFKKRFISSWYK